MPLYFLVHDAALFEGTIRPALAASWAQRSFSPCRSLWETLRPTVASFTERFRLDAEEMLLPKAGKDLPFDRGCWRLLVGEVLLCAAANIPELQTMPDTLSCLLTPESGGGEDMRRDRFTPIQQVHYGTRYLTFGATCYRPDRVGINNCEDVARLATYLAEVRPNNWTPEQLASLRGMADDGERADELELAREWFPAFQALYRQAEDRKQIVICELL